MTNRREVICTERKNFHTHTISCDGKNSAEETVLKAIEKGFSALGFSGHSYTFFDGSYCMTEDGTLQYIKEVKRLREKYRGEIRIYLGLEADYFAENIDFDAYDFIIGSVHYLKLGGEFIPVDHTAECQRETGDRFFGGSFDKYCEAYYELVADVAEKTHADLIGHFDLVTKFNDADCLFSTETPAYIGAWRSAADVLIRRGIPFEINTGAIARGRRKTPYPSHDIAKYISDNGGSLAYSSDCHDAEMLDCEYEKCMALYGDCRIADFEKLIKK